MSVHRAFTCAVALSGAIAAATAQSRDRSSTADRVRMLTRDSAWTRVAAVPVGFRTHHPQGMVKIGDTFFVSSVEMTERTRRFAQPQDGYDRTAGRGVGHLFKIDGSGNLVADATLGEGTIYHPGGIDYDGKSLWVPVAEYRPDSRSIVYRVDPRTMQAAEVFRFEDHLGGVAYNIDDNTLHAVSWGSRRFYRWTMDGSGKVANGSTPAGVQRTLNPSHYVDYQDCKYAGGRRMLCTGVTEIRVSPGAAPFPLGGMDLIDLQDGRPIHQVPVLLWTAGGRSMTQNPVWLETTASGVRGYFMPDDDKSTIYVYDVEVDLGASRR